MFMLPFFVVELFGFLQFFLSVAVGICCAVTGSQTMKKLVAKCDLLFFIGQKDPSRREQVLCLEAAKLVFSTGPQLCLQLWLLEATIAPSEFQYLSIISSCLLGTKLAYELISYSRQEESAAIMVETSGKEKCKEKFCAFLKVFLDYLSWLPLILTSLLYKIGSINLYMKFFGLFSVLMVLLLIFLHTVVSFLLSRFGSVSENPGVSVWTVDLKNDGNKPFMFLDNLFVSFSNIFVVSRPFNTIRKLFLPWNIA